MASVTAWVCDGCGTGYRVRLFTCPRCHGTTGHAPDEIEEKHAEDHGARGAEQPVRRAPGRPRGSAARVDASAGAGR